MIPRIIHQSYKTINHPYPKAWQRTWLDNHAGWKYCFHSDADNRRIVSQYIPQFLRVFDAFPRGIIKADFCRFLYMYLWGGIYADLDYICLRPFDKLITNCEPIGIPELPQNKCYRYHNALLISEPGNVFWIHCAERAIKRFLGGNRARVEAIAGPLCLQASIRSVQPLFCPLPMDAVTPIDWFSYNRRVGLGDKQAAALRGLLKDSPIEVIRNRFPKAYSITFWNHGW